MARTNLNAVRIRPETSELLTLHVERSTRLSPHVQRITFGSGDIRRFQPMGFDQWFRLFIPVTADSLLHLPRKLNTLAYLKFLTTAKTSRPVLRNYSVRAYRDDPARGPQIDVDFILHEPAGVAATWAQSCVPGDPVAILDEGIGFNPPTTTHEVFLAADESAMPAAAGILASLPDHARGHAIIEIPDAADRQPLAVAAGVEVIWLTRGATAAVPGTAALEAARRVPISSEACHRWVAGE